MQDLENKLVENKWVANEELYLAKQESIRTGKSVWLFLVKFGYLTEEELVLFFSLESGTPGVRICDYKIKQEVLDLVDEDFCRQNLVIPLFKLGNTLFVACANPFNTALIDNLARITACTIEPLIASAHSISQALDLYWRLDDQIFEAGKFIIKQGPVQGFNLWRESERLPLKIVVALGIEGNSISLHSAHSIIGNTRDISKDGAALGMEISLFLPKSMKVSLEFKPLLNTQAMIGRLKAKAEIMHCRMEKAGNYFLGLKFTEIQDSLRNTLLKLAAG